MDTKTARINILVRPDEKALIEARAEAAKITVSELMRRAVANYQPESPAADEAEVRELAEMVGGVAERLEAKLDRGLAEIAELKKAFPAAAQRDAALAEGAQ